MAPTRMKLRVRRRGGAAGDAAGDERPEGEESGRAGGARTSRRKNTNTSNAPAPAASPPPSSSTAASARAVMAAEEASPDSKCPICLDRFNNLAYLDRCLHRFCFPCIQEWSHNKAECPLCKQPFASILHSVRAEDDFKEYTLRQPPANSSVAATVALVAAMASAARNNHQMRLMLRRHRGTESGETTTRRRRRERGGRARGGNSMGEAVWEWYLDSPPITLPPFPHHPVPSPATAENSEEAGDSVEQRTIEDADPPERGVIFEGLTGLGGAVTPLAPNDRESRRLLSRLVTRRRLQREGGPVRRARERETVAFRRALYRCGIRVSGVASVGTQGQQQRDITAEGFRHHPTLLSRLRPWLRRELTVLYGAHGSLVDIVQRIVMARLSRHGLEDTPTIEEELRPFLLARTDHFLHELVSFARSPLSLENYDLQAVYEPPSTALELDGASSSSDNSSVIAISEGEEERPAGERPEELLRRAESHDGIIQAGSNLSLSAWDDETPGPSYSTAEPSSSLASLSFSPIPQEAANEEGAEKEEEECLIVGYKKPIAERTPELVQLSSDSEEEQKEHETATDKLPLLPPSTPPLSYLPIMPPSTSGSSRQEQEEKLKEHEMTADSRLSRQRSWSSSSERSRNSLSTLSPTTAGHSERGQDKEKMLSTCETAREKKRRKKSRQEREGRRTGTLYNPNRCIYPAMLRRRSRSSSPLHSSVGSSPPDSSWEYHSSQVSPLTSSASSPSCSSWSSSLPCPSPLPSSRKSPSASPGNLEKPGGKRKYKSRHLDNDSLDPTWRPSSSRSRERRRERKEKERRRRKRRERRRRRSSGRDRRRSRVDRSPSVEIIYEGTTAAAQPLAQKRRRKRQRRTQHSSPPVVITLDSDSSHGDIVNNNNNNNNDSSSPLSSQHTVDFSHLPPIPLLPSAGMGPTLHPDLGELPVDILDRGSDGWDTEPVVRCDTVSPIAVDNSDRSDVDIETVEERKASPPPGPRDGQGPMRGRDPKQEVEEVDSRPTVRGIAESDSRLLASVLNDLQGIAAAKRSPPTSVLSNGPCNNMAVQSDVMGHRSWGSEQQPINREQNHTSAPPPPILGRLAEGKDLPSLLRQSSPVRMYSRNTPPPLKHKDAVSPLLFPPISSSWGSEMLTDGSSIPPISTLKRCLTSPTPSAPPTSTCDTDFLHQSAAPRQNNPSSSVSTSCCPSKLDPMSHPVSSLILSARHSADSDSTGGGAQVDLCPRSVCNDPLPLRPPMKNLSDEVSLATSVGSLRPNMAGDLLSEGLPASRGFCPDNQEDRASSGHLQNDHLVPTSPKATANLPSFVSPRSEGLSTGTAFKTPPEELLQLKESSPVIPKHHSVGSQSDSSVELHLPAANHMPSSAPPAEDSWSSEHPGPGDSSSSYRNKHTHTAS